MNCIRQIGLILMFLFLLPVGSVGQVDEISQATGLPIPIGAPVIYGQVSIRGIDKDERKPIVFAVLYEGGIQLDRRQASDSGYYYFLRTPQNGQVVAFEINGMEIGRTVIIAGMSNRVREDVSIDWQSLKGAIRQIIGTVTAKDHIRGAEAEKAFDKAMAAFTDKQHAKAIGLFKAIVKNDPEDFFAWTVLGAVYLAENMLPESSQAVEKALQLNPDFLLALITLGKLELSKKNFDKAIELFSRAVQVSPQSAEANHMLGESYLQAKKGSLAVGYLNKAIELAPIEKADIHLRLALLYNAAGVKDRAVAEYKAFLEKVRDHPDKQRIEKYIKENSSN